MGTNKAIVNVKDAKKFVEQIEFPVIFKAAHGGGILK